MSKYNITMKQKSDSDYNELYPESLDTQIKLSKDTTGFTGTNVSEVLMELNSKIPGVLPEAGTYQLVGCVENYRNNQAITGKTVCITNIDLTNGVTVHWGCRGDNPGYSLWSLTLLVFKRMNE